MIAVSAAPLLDRRRELARQKEALVPRHRRLDQQLEARRLDQQLAREEARRVQYQPEPPAGACGAGRPGHGAAACGSSAYGEDRAQLCVPEGATGALSCRLLGTGCASSTVCGLAAFTV